VALMLDADGDSSWPAGVVFGIAGITDQVDGFLARRWHVESPFGKVADPLADRLMIDAAVILLVIADRLPWVAIVVIGVRDLILLGGYKLVVPRGYEFGVTFVGKAATWVLYASVAFVIVTHKGTDWPPWSFWTGLALALVASVQSSARYVAMRLPSTPAELDSVCSFSTPSGAAALLRKSWQPYSSPATRLSDVAPKKIGCRRTFFIVVCFL